MSRKVPLYVSNRKAYLWSVDDIETLRSQHRICGQLIGTLPHLSQQNAFLGLPMVLMDEEAVLLVEEGIATFIDDPAAHTSPAQEEIDRWNAYQRSTFSSSLPSAPHRAAADKPLSEEAVAKRRARQEKKAAMDIQRSIDNDSAVAEQQQDETDKMSQSPAGSIEPLISVPRSSATFAWHRAVGKDYTDLSSAMSAGIWTYPSLPQHRARCAVFRYLWSQGYFLGIGIKFGGDFLVYPGDPLRFHSHFTATVHLKSESISPMQIVAHGRLGTGTRKTHLLCSWDATAGTVECISVEWAGFG